MLKFHAILSPDEPQVGFYIIYFFCLHSNINTLEIILFQKRRMIFFLSASISLEYDLLLEVSIIPIFIISS